MTDLRQQIAAALKDFETYPLPEAATRLFARKKVPDTF